MSVSPRICVPSTNFAQSVTCSSVEGRTRRSGDTPSCRPMHFNAFTISCFSMRPAIITLPTVCPTPSGTSEPFPSKRWRQRATSSATRGSSSLASASKHRSASEGGRIPRSSRRIPELPPESAMETTAVISTPWSMLRARRTTGWPVPPPKVATRIIMVLPLFPKGMRRAQWQALRVPHR